MERSTGRNDIDNAFITGKDTDIIKQQRDFKNRIKATDAFLDMHLQYILKQNMDLS